MKAKRGPKSVPGLIRSIWRMVKPYKSSVRTAFFWIFLNQLAGLVEPTIMMILIDYLVEQKSSGKHDHFIFLMMCLGAFMAYAILGLGNRLKNKAVYKITNQIEFDLKVDSIGRVLRLPIFHFQADNSGKFIGSLSRGVSESIQVMWMLAFDMLPVLATSAIAFVALLVMKPIAILILLPNMALFFFLTHLYRQRTAETRKKTEDAHEKSESHVSEILENIQTVQAYVQERNEHRKLTDLWSEELDLDIKLENGMVNWSYLDSLLLIAGRLSILAVCGLAVFEEKMSIGQLFFVLQLAGQAFGATQSLSRFQQRLIRAEEPITRTLKLLDPDKSAEESISNIQKDRPKLKGEIEFLRVSYTYPKLEESDRKDGDTNPAVLHSISFSIKPGYLVGIVGASGGGKTTLLNLLMGFDYPDAGGSILIDGKTLDETMKRELRQSASLVASRVELQSASIFDNIAYGYPEATDEDVREAAVLANAHEFIQKLPNKYHEKIGNHGARLSAGQQQRICLARALVRKPSILVLDEAAMHLDVENAVYFKHAIESLRGRCTIVHATHNIWEIANADLILVISQGRLEAKGTHNQLMAISPIYRRMHDKQASMFATMSHAFSRLDIN